MIQLFRADGIYLGYYHPEFVDLAKLKKYRVDGEEGLFVSAKDVKDAVGTEKWNVLASNETSYLFDERLVTKLPEECGSEKTSIFDHPQHAGIFKVEVRAPNYALVKSRLYETREAYETWRRRHRNSYNKDCRVIGYHRIGKEWIEDTTTIS